MTISSTTAINELQTTIMWTLEFISNVKHLLQYCYYYRYAKFSYCLFLGTDDDDFLRGLPL